MSQVALHVHLLGAFRVLINGQPVSPDAWRSRRASSLVKLLALAPQSRLPREQIAETLWPGFAIDAQLNNLNVATTRARRALASAGAPSATYLIREGDALVLGPSEALWIDVVAFERGVSDGWRTLDPAVCRAALARYTGDLLPDDAYEEWVDVRRNDLRPQFLSLLTKLAQLHEERGEFSYAIEAWQRLVSAEPTDEAAHLGLIRLYDRIGQRHQALAQFDQLTTALRRYLDVEPHCETIAVVQSIRAARPKGTLQPEASAQSVDLLSHGRVPLPLNDLIGRDRERVELRTRLALGRLVTLTGPGGIGKTRLALAIADEVERAFPDGVVFVDLSPFNDPDLVVPAIAQALDVQGQSGEPSVLALATHLAAKRLLLVLDNFEQVIAAAPTVTALLERARHCRVLVTSRVPLHLRGESEYPVPSLLLPDSDEVRDERTLLRSPAVALFVQRARDVKPDFAITASNAATVAEICRLLDGLPLAIELAATRVKVLTPAAMLTRLDKPLALLTGGPRDLPLRQQTIRNTIAWSYDLLSAPEQLLLRRLSIFIGGWILQSAQWVVDPDRTLGIDLLDGLASLVDKNLVVQKDEDDGEIRFTMRETIREFAVEQLMSTSDQLTMRDRHASFAVAFAEHSAPHLEGSDLPLWMTRLDREDANLRAARQWLRDRHDVERSLRLLTALQLYVFIRGRLAEGCTDLLETARLPEAMAFPIARIDGLTAAAFLARENRDYERAYDASAEARDEADRIGDPRRKADALINLGYVVLQRGDHHAARELFQESLHINHTLDNDQGIADALSFLGLTASYEDDLANAVQLNEESLAIWERLQDHQAIVWARTRLGSVLIRREAYTDAYVQFMTSLAISQELDFRWGFSWSLDGLAHLSLIGGDRDLAIELMTTATSIRDAFGLRLPPAEHDEIARLQDELGIQGSLVADPSIATEGLPHRMQQVGERVQQALAKWFVR